MAAASVDLPAVVVPGGVAGTPATDSRRLEAAYGTGRSVVEMVAAGWGWTCGRLTNAVSMMT